MLSSKSIKLHLTSSPCKPHDGKTRPRLVNVVGCDFVIQVLPHRLKTGKVVLAENLISGRNTETFRSILRYPEEAWDKIFEINVKVSFLLFKECVPHMQVYSHVKQYYIWLRWTTITDLFSAASIFSPHFSRVMFSHTNVQTNKFIRC